MPSDGETGESSRTPGRKAPEPSREVPGRQAPRTTLNLDRHAHLLGAILEEVEASARWSPTRLSTILRRHPLPDGSLPSKLQILRAYRELSGREDKEPDPVLLRRLQVKPTRTISGVAPVTVLTKPAPCPGECIFCPSIGDMPKSYLPDEPGAMRAVDHAFDPFDQAASRIAVLARNGHNVDKIELLILGGTWSSYPEAYQEWFVRRCLDAMNGTVSTSMEQAQGMNEEAAHRNVGLVVETRPDCITVREVQRLRWLGVTKVQVGVQSLSDQILKRNRRGHTLAETRSAMRLLRLAGFKIVAHWMPNLLGATPETDLEDFRQLWDDPALRPDELKIYPTALLPDTELHERWIRGEYQPYQEKMLVELVARCKMLIPEYCRVNRLMRDIPAPNIVAGVKRSNLRQVVQRHMAQIDQACRCIRCREVRGGAVDARTLKVERLDYDTDATRECFLSAVTPDNRLAGFLRLSLPHDRSPIEELDGCAVIREVHIYGPAVALGARVNGRAQHAGLGSHLIMRATEIARQEEFERLAVIAAVGTRPYYRERGFALERLYMIRPA